MPIEFKLTFKEEIMLDFPRQLAKAERRERSNTFFGNESCSLLTSLPGSSARKKVVKQKVLEEKLLVFLEALFKKQQELRSIFYYTEWVSC